MFNMTNPQGMKCKKCKGPMSGGMFYAQKGPNIIGLGQSSQGDGPYCLRCYDSIKNPPEADTVLKRAQMWEQDKKTGLDKAIKKSNTPRERGGRRR